MRPNREAFEDAVSLYAQLYRSGSPEETERDREARHVAQNAVLGVYDAQEAQIRELVDALEAVLGTVERCKYIDSGYTCDTHSTFDLDGTNCPFDRAREVLARARGES